MKLKIIFLMVSLVINNIECKSRSKDIVGEICKWQATRESLIDQLTPNGQETAKKIMLGFQRISSAGMQAVYNRIAQEFDYEIKILNDSDDASKLAKLEKIYGKGDLNSGNGPLNDLCQEAKNIKAILYSFKKENLPLIIKILTAADKGFKNNSPIFQSITRYLTSDLETKLIATENIKVLTDLATLYQKLDYWK